MFDRRVCYCEYARAKVWRGRKRKTCDMALDWMTERLNGQTIHFPHLSCFKSILVTQLLSLRLDVMHDACKRDEDLSLKPKTVCMSFQLAQDDLARISTY